MGVIAKDRANGKLADEYRKAIAGHKMEQIDVSNGIALVLAVKDDDELVRLLLLKSENDAAGC